MRQHKDQYNTNICMGAKQKKKRNEANNRMIESISKGRRGQKYWKSSCNLILGGSFHTPAAPTVSGT